MTISQFALAGSAKSDFGVLQNGCNPGAVIGEFSYCSVTFTFTPSASGTRVAEVNIDYIGGSGPVSVPLAAAGLAPSRALTLGSSELTFEAEPVGVPTEASTSIANIGSEAVTLSGVSLAGTNAQDYAITGNNCPQAPATLPPLGELRCDPAIHGIGFGYAVGAIAGLGQRVGESTKPAFGRIRRELRSGTSGLSKRGELHP